MGDGGSSARSIGCIRVQWSPHPPPPGEPNIHLIVHFTLCDHNTPPTVTNTCYISLYVLPENLLRSYSSIADHQSIMHTHLR